MELAPTQPNIPEPEVDSASELDSEQDSAPLAGKRKRGPTYDWTEKWTCDHSGRYRDERKKDLSPSKRRHNRHHGSIRIGCKAHIWFRRRVGQSNIEVTYHWQHSGHTPGSLKDIGESRMTDRVKDWLNARVDEGLDWKAVKDLLRVDEAALDKIQLGLEGKQQLSEIPESLRVAQKDVYNALRRRLASISHFDPDGRKSLTKWKEKLEARGYKVLYQPLSVQLATENAYVFAMVSPWQQTLLQKYSRIACMDSTHNTCYSANSKEESVFLYTIVLKNLATGKGSPAAFMLTTNETQYPIIDWLRWLSVSLNFKPISWMIDCSDTETAAIRHVHGPNTRIFECLWHVMKAVTEQSKKKLSALTVPKGETKASANRALRESGKQDFIKMVYAASEEDFKETWEEVRVYYKDHKEWLSYLTGEWMGKKEKWALCYRLNTPHYRIETNNYTESWHHHFKVFYLRLMRKQRIDVDIHILTEKVEPDFRRAELRVLMNFEAPVFSKVERESRRKAYRLDASEINEMVEYGTEEEEHLLYVQSFNDPDTWYTVTTHDFSQGSKAQTDGSEELGSPDAVAIISCDCEGFTSSESTCKHMFLASRVSAHPIRRYNASIPSRAHAINNPLPAAPTAAEVDGQKDASISRLLEEVQTIMTLSSRLKNITFDDVSRSMLTPLESRFTSRPQRSILYCIFSLNL